MGSWDEYCSLSGVSIKYGQSAYIVPLKPKEYNEWDRRNEINIFNTGIRHYNSSITGGLWEEVTFPIKGFYDDYGRITGIIEDENTLSIEEYYKIPIKQFVSILIDKTESEYYNKNNKKHNELLQYSITWFDGEIYDSIEKIDFGYRAWGYFKFLEELGFEYKGIDKNIHPRYCYIFTKNNIIIYSDGMFIKSTNLDIDYLKIFLKDDINFEKYEKLNTNQFNYRFCPDFYRDKLLLFGQNLWDNPKYNYNNILATLPFDIWFNNKNNNLDIKSANDFMEFCFIKYLNGKDFYNICSRWNNIKDALNNMGRFLSPIGYGPQYGDCELLKKILSVFTKRNNKLIKEEEDY